MLSSRVSVVESCIQFFITGPPYGHNDDDARRQTFSGNFNILKTLRDALKQLKVLILIHFVRPVILLQVATSMQNYLILCSFNFSVPCRITR